MQVFITIIHKERFDLTYKGSVTVVVTLKLIETFV